MRSMPFRQLAGERASDAAVALCQPLPLPSAQSALESAFFFARFPPPRFIHFDGREPPFLRFEAMARSRPERGRREAAGHAYHRQPAVCGVAARDKRRRRLTPTPPVLRRGERLVIFRRFHFTILYGASYQAARRW